MIATMKNLTSETIENLFAALGVPLAPGRAERLAPAVNGLNVDDPLREKLPVEVDPTTYVLAQERCR
jgi:ribosomal protein L12E/L44/L45/RPP1/RPP2